MRTLNIGNLTATIPVIQGGMGVGVSLSSLAGAVAAEGGIGIISTAQIGFSEPEYELHPLASNLKMIGEHIKRARKIAPHGIIGVNIMVATKQYASYVKEAIHHGIDLIISGAGLPLELPSLAKGSSTKLVPIVSSVKAANVIFRMWDKKNQTTPDAIIVEGPKAGGHLGFKLEEIEGYTQEQFDGEIKRIIEVAKQYGNKYGKEIPVIVAGGIRTSKDMKHYLSLGAKGVQIASQFVTTEECDAHSRYKEAYINCHKEDIILVKSPVGMPGRAIRNQFTNRVSMEKIPVTHCKGCVQMCNPKETPYCITDALIQAVTGNLEEGLLFCGGYAYEQNRMQTVREVLEQYKK